ncbi:MAG: hypothetical protein AAB438_00270 [Patescibacteria group bacterium]
MEQKEKDENGFSISVKDHERKVFSFFEENVTFPPKRKSKKETSPSVKELAQKLKRKKLQFQKQKQKQK